MTTVTARDIYARIKELGLTRAQVRKLLPSWWEPNSETLPDGFAELCVLISRRLNLDLSELLNGNVQQKGSALSVAYKHRSDASPASLQGSTLIASSLSRAVIAAMDTPYSPIPYSPEELVQTVREMGNGAIGLSSLIDTCWAMGVPVIPLPNLPIGIKKMDGAVITVNDRPSIIVSKKRSSQAWLGFIVAHEIGHIGRRHLESNSSIIDISLQENATYEVESSADQQEREADEYALSLLGGERVEDVISTWPTWASAVDIAVRSREAASELGIESGHLALRYGFKTKRWPDAMNALRFLSEDFDAEQIMKDRLLQNLNLDSIADDLRDFVRQITGIDNC